MRGLGGVIDMVDENFDPEGGAYSGSVHAHSHGHSHGHDHDHDHDHDHVHDPHAAPRRAAGQHTDARHSPRIHDFMTDPLKR